MRRGHRLALPLAERVMKSAELDFSRWLALVMLRDGLADTCGGLARCLGHDNGATTRLIDQLADHGFVSRHRSKADRRVVHIALTDTGKDAVDRLAPRIVDLWNGLLADFTVEEVDMLRTLLTRLNRSLEAADAEIGA